LIKLREILEKMYLSNFRQSYKPQILDIDANRRNLQLFLTRNCNLNCRHCYFSAGKALAEELSTEEWKRIIRSFAHLGQGNAVTFTGGEPLTHPDFFDIAQTAMDNGLKVILLTNGGLIKDRAMARKIADLTDTVQVSLDGATAETNDAIRGVGSFAGAVNGIRLLLAEKAEVEMTCVVLPENVEDLEKNLTKFIEEFASSRLRCSLSVANPKGRLKGVEIAEAESLVGRVISACGNVNWLRKGGFHSGQGCFGCEIANSIVVNPSGKIGNCPYLNYSGPGKIKDEDFAKLIETDRVWHRQAIKDSDKCRNCDLRNFQCGGCKIFGACTEQLKLRNYYRMLYGN
jgi:radical SAM protein with 4Fe4S-binding SPASM domain